MINNGLYDDTRFTSTICTVFALENTLIDTIKIIEYYYVITTTCSSDKLHLNVDLTLERMPPMSTENN